MWCLLAPSPRRGKIASTQEWLDHEWVNKSVCAATASVIVVWWKEICSYMKGHEVRARAQITASDAQAVCCLFHYIGKLQLEEKYVSLILWCFKCTRCGQTVFAHHLFCYMISGSCRTQWSCVWETVKLWRLVNRWRNVAASPLLTWRETTPLKSLWYVLLNVDIIQLASKSALKIRMLSKVSDRCIWSCTCLLSPFPKQDFTFSELHSIALRVGHQGANLQKILG